MEETFNRAGDLWSSGDEEEAITLLSPLIQKGHVAAKSMLGLILCYLHRDGQFPRMADGEKLLSEACEAGDASACHNLGTLWLGNVPAIGKDLRRAAFYYLRAKELGGPVANKEFYEHWESVLNG